MKGIHSLRRATALSSSSGSNWERIERWRRRSGTSAGVRPTAATGKELKGPMRRFERVGFPDPAATGKELKGDADARDAEDAQLLGSNWERIERGKRGFWAGTGRRLASPPSSNWERIESASSPPSCSGVGGSSGSNWERIENSISSLRARVSNAGSWGASRAGALTV